MISSYGGMAALVEVIQERGVMSKKSIYLYSHIDYGHMDQIVYEAVVHAIRDDVAHIPAYFTELVMAHIIGCDYHGWYHDDKISYRLKEQRTFGISLVPLAPKHLSHINVVDIPKQRLGMWTYTGEPDMERMQPKEWLTFKAIKNRLDD